MRILLAANWQTWKNHSPGIISVCAAFMLYDLLKGHLTLRVMAVDVGAFATFYVLTVAFYVVWAYAVLFWPRKKSP